MNRFLSISSEILLTLFKYIILASIFIPNSLDFWIPNK